MVNLPAHKLSPNCDNRDRTANNIGIAVVRNCGTLKLHFIQSF